VSSQLSITAIGTFRLSFARFGPTELRILLALANAALWFSPNAAVPAYHLRLLDFGGLIGSCAMFLMAIVAAIIHTRELYLQEPSR
jgi:hypothetical protein